MDGVQQGVFFVLLEARGKVQPHLNIVTLSTFEPVLFSRTQVNTFQKFIVERLHPCWGWRGRRAVRVLYTGAVLLMLSYVGSRLVLELLLGRNA